jgi:acetoin utilization protein AcuC
MSAGVAGEARAPVFIGSEIYRRSSYGAWHPLRVPRVSTVIDLLRALGWLAPGQYQASPRAKPKALTAWHTPDYVAALMRAEAEGAVSAAVRARHGLGTTSNPVFADMFRRPATSAGAVMLAAELVRDGGVVYSPAGGTHHGMRDRASGFCYLNDPVLCVLTLRRLGLRRIAYVDIDAHHPDGVEAAFAGDAEVLLISVHEEGRWPFTGALEADGGGNCFNLPVPKEFNDTEMRAALEEVILPRVAAHQSEAVILQSGADALAEDPLSRLSLSNNAHREVVLALKALAPRLIVLGGGGYNAWSVGRCWAGVWAALAGREVPDRLPAEAEAVLRGLGPFRQKGREVAETLYTTLQDPAREGPVREEVRDRIRRLARR